MLEATETIRGREMKDQVLDQMELERERGITIKMTPARMKFSFSPDYLNRKTEQKKTQNDTEMDVPRTSGSRPSSSGRVEDYTLNLIDTPGHIDFSYEVSRALKAVEGAVLLVDATQGVQAQTLTTLDIARELDLIIIPAISKIDSPRARIEETVLEVSDLLGCSPDKVIRTSGKTGDGVSELLERIIQDVPPPENPRHDTPQLLVFDFDYSNHQGVIVYTRVFGGSVRAGDDLVFAAGRERFTVKEVGVFTPIPVSRPELGTGEIGYIVTGVKEPGVVSVGDTLCASSGECKPLSGYKQPQPVVWASIFPQDSDNFNLLRRGLERLRLTDSALSFEEMSSPVLGRGFRCGLLGMLHLEIVAERLKREHDVRLVVASPSVTYTVATKDGAEETIYSPARFPDHGRVEEVREPWVDVDIIVPTGDVSRSMQLFFDYEVDVTETSTFGEGRTKFDAHMPLRTLMRGFFDDLKRVTSGYGSISYRLLEETREADVKKLEVLVAEEAVPAFTTVVSSRRVETEAREAVERLYELLPRQLTKTKIQARAGGRIIASKTLPALRKDVTGHLYGGDVTRKRKLLEKQKEGKKRMQKRASADIPHDVFVKMIRR